MRTGKSNSNGFEVIARPVGKLVSVLRLIRQWHVMRSRWKTWCDLLWMPFSGAEESRPRFSASSQPNYQIVHKTLKTGKRQFRKRWMFLGNHL